MRERRLRRPRWLSFHAITAPVGIAAVTAALAWLGLPEDDGQPATVRYLNAAAAQAYLGTITYAFIAACAEGVGAMFFWAWEQHRNKLENAKAEGRTQGRAEGRESASNEYEAKLTAARQRAKEEGIDLDRFLNP